MTPLLDRIRANGGEVVRTGWQVSVRPGRLSVEAIEWLRHRKDQLLQEAWAEFDAWSERAAILEFCGNTSREEAERAAYDEVAQ